MKQSIHQIRQLLEQPEVEQEQLDKLAGDERKGVQTLLKQYRKRQEERHQLLAMHDQMNEYERQLRSQGYHALAGIDEVGRGPLAGPVVAAAVILPPDFRLLGLTDSKKLTKQKREAFSEIIKREAVAYSIEMVHADEIDRINIYQATKMAMKAAISTLHKEPDYLLLDAMSLQLDIPQTSLIKGDEKSITIAASSVIAKVARDTYMAELETKYPGYGFSRHAGYGTKEHLAAIDRLGVTPEHRRSFKPVQERA
ncbi:ribonuclease HII [Alkalihalobacillus oceani]|uniref:ribonuclease HII n=1 Tax=Halalkalibacter oceani TaxID=1653776 RepID=UPI00203B1AA6|nr:ribonuclease HII [Halalkalibacter oceani]MCM3759429.1 ribonuclease HII [Halalkalibacter oceani]